MLMNSVAFRSLLSFRSKLTATSSSTTNVLQADGMEILDAISSTEKRPQSPRFSSNRIA